MKKFEDLTEREVLALAIALEEEDERVYADFADGLRQDYPATASMFLGMREEESEHRRSLIELYREKFGDHIPLIRRQDVKGFVYRRPVRMIRPLGLDAVRGLAGTMAADTRRFYEAASACTRDPRIRQLLDDLAQAAARVMVGQTLQQQGITAEPVPRYVSVKEAVFPFAKFSGVDIVLGPEMRSTGEVMGIAMDFHAAFAKSKIAALSRLWAQRPAGAAACGPPPPATPRGGGAARGRAALIQALATLSSRFLLPLREKVAAKRPDEGWTGARG